MYGPGNSFKALKHRHVSSTSTGPRTFRWSTQASPIEEMEPDPYDLSSSTTFVSGDVFDGPLDFGEIEGLAPEWNHVAEYGADFAEFVRVAGDEVEFLGGHGARDGFVD